MVHLRDDRELIRSELGALLSKFDVVVLSGGISTGKFDYLGSVLPELGVTSLFRKVRQRPGQPFWFGRTTTGTAVFALPGNPVSTTVCFYRHVLPFLGACLTGHAPEPEYAVLAEDFEFEPELTLFLPVALRSEPDGRLAAMPKPVRNSGDFATLGMSDGFIELSADRSHFARGTSWPLYRWGRP